ncbi:glycosyltransferase family 2 protein [Confluentibacter lentus]|uniref:glycosyltransferase family 2 protein n=1 Tax=Confluentibacter lentus TaxID=1699412 RepID=UPI000C290158|nr:glycosyltransferase [Confluentibacter lentus]
MLAIVIPYYKHTFFESTLLALKSQTNKQFAVYIGDDAGPDDPKELIEKYKDAFTINYKRFDSNLGSISLVKQWERCLDMVQDETWVVILGDDDVVSDSFVAEFYNHLDEITKLKIDVVRYSTVVINEDGEEISKTHKHPKLETASDFLIRKFKGGTRSSLSEYIFKKEKIDAIKFKDFPLAWSSDLLGVIEFSCGNNIYTINSALVYFRLSRKNITGKTDSIEKNEAWFHFYDYLLTNFGKQYSKELINMLFNRLEKVQLNNKKTPLRWMRLFLLYVRFHQYHRFLLLFLKIKRSIR